MYFEVILICGGILVSGFVLGMIPHVVRPRDEEDAATPRQLARRPTPWLPGRIRAHHDRGRPLTGSGVRG
ncbi:MAG TPA: hypothetical protein VLA55_10520 [Ornithinibacter sp.]|nr:hypothetical protein [Ornithinibacter sp.]